MREHELELIAALAEGRLEDEAEARALIATSEEAAAEFEAQSLALRALSDASPVEMSATERAALRRDLWTEFRAPVATVTSASKPWYYRWMPVAAGMFVLVGLVAVLNQGGLQDMAAEDQAALGAGASTVAASGDTDDMAEESDDGDSGGETAAPTSTMAAAGDGDTSAQAPPEAAAFYSAEADAIRSGDEAEPQTRATDTPTPEELADCLQRAGREGYEVLEVDPAPEETSDTYVPEEAVPYIAAIPFGEDLATASVVFVALDTCEVIHIDG